jgi:DNA polymerase III subunit epsilon
MLLFFDTETSGLPRSHHAPVSDLANWPRIVQIAWLLTDQQGTTHQAVEAIIRPEGFSIPADAARVHGITTARALTEGQLLSEVLQQFLAALRQADILIAHNLAFDEKVLGAELLRCGLPNPLPTLRCHCTMEPPPRSASCRGVTATNGPGSMSCTAICLGGGWAQPTTPWWM